METPGGPCCAVILDVTPLFSVLADATAGMAANRARARSRRVAFRAFAIHPPGASNGMVFQ